MIHNNLVCVLPCPAHRIPYHRNDMSVSRFSVGVDSVANSSVSYAVTLVPSASVNSAPLCTLPYTPGSSLEHVPMMDRIELAYHRSYRVWFA